MPTRPKMFKPAYSPNPVRETACQRGYGHGWREARAIFLRANPLCAMCKANNRVVSATVVDHKTPHRGDTALFWDQGNWQPLCATCHNTKTAKEDGGFGRAVSQKCEKAPSPPKNAPFDPENRKNAKGEGDRGSKSLG